MDIQGSVKAPLLFFVMIIDLPRVLNQACFLIDDGLKSGGIAVQRTDIQANIFAEDARAGRSNMI